MLQLPSLSGRPHSPQDHPSGSLSPSPLPVFCPPPATCRQPPGLRCFLLIAFWQGCPHPSTPGPALGVGFLRQGGGDVSLATGCKANG